VPLVHVGTGVPGNPLVSIEQVPPVAVSAPTFWHTAAQVTGSPTVPGVGEQLMVLTMSGVVGAPLMVTCALLGLLPSSAAGSLVAAVVAATVTGPLAGAVKMMLQPNSAPGARSTPTPAFGHTMLAPAGTFTELTESYLHVAPRAVLAPTFVHVTAHDTVAPATALLGSHVTALAMSGGPGGTSTVLAQPFAHVVFNGNCGIDAVFCNTPLVALAGVPVTVIAKLAPAASPATFALITCPTNAGVLLHAPTGTQTADSDPSAAGAVSLTVNAPAATPPVLLTVIV